jgi:ABC-type antimicrobial peptide transport system permease subunit
MYYRYQPYPYYNRYYNLNPYYYGRYYNPYYNYQRNIIDSQISDVNQSINNFGSMTDVIQDANVYQLMTPEPENVGICTEPPA